jgi:hypothetical protein
MDLGVRNPAAPAVTERRYSDVCPGSSCKDKTDVLSSKDGEVPSNKVSDAPGAIVFVSDEGFWTEIENIFLVISNERKEGLSFVAPSR